MSTCTYCVQREAAVKLPRASAATYTPRVRQFATTQRNAHNTLRLRSHRASRLSTRASNGDETNNTQDSNAPINPSTVNSVTAPAPAGNYGLAIGTVFTVAAGLLAGKIIGTEQPSFASLEQVTVPYEVALSNNKPTVLEFYATWCEVCKQLLPTEMALAREYGNNVNFVMLNIDNTKWSQEQADYAVRGIPHFVFLDNEGSALTAAVGQVPESVLRGNIQALASGQPLPFTGARGVTSQLTAPNPLADSSRQISPRAHS